MQVLRLPYEVLFRFDEAGALVGAHVQWRHLVVDEQGNKVAEAIEHAKAVDVGQGEGFPLDDIMSAVTKAAVLQAEAVTNRLIDIGEERPEAMAGIDGLKAQIAAAKA
jgi:hypothetical protein